MLKEIPVKTGKRIELVDVTGQVQEIVSKSGVKDGLCVVYSPHTTAALIITENADPSVQRDIITKLSKMVPENEGYTHMEGNSDAHIKSAVIGNSRTVIVRGGQLLLGIWEGIMFFEGDGPRSRKLFVKTIEG
jgi:secondary thiamine-phosphate synthase enzyme